MAEFRVRFIGDLGNLSAFNAAIRNSLSSNAAILERANSSVVSRAVGERVQPSRNNGAGLFVRNAVTEIDRLNNSFLQSGTTVRRYVDGFTTETRKIKDVLTGLEYEKTFARPVFKEAFHSDFRKAIGNVEAYERAIARLAPVEKQMIAREGRAASQIAQIDTAQAQVAAYSRLKPNAQTAAQRQSVFNSLNRVIPGTLAGPDDLENIEGSLAKTTGKIQTNLHQQRLTIQKSLRDELNQLKNDPVVKAISQEAFYAATSPEGRLGRETTNVLNRYPAVRQDLEKKIGLGGGQVFQNNGVLNPQYAINAQNQDFKIDSVYRDMERGLVRVSGAARGADGIMTQFSYTVDKNGNAINSWGRNLSGTRNFLDQTTRNLIKFVEWTVASAAVLGTLGIAFSSFTKINELNVGLQRFAITARLTNEELAGMFEGLSQVAFNTATPIGELVKAADDMALATRRANQSTTEWRASILELANAVGILTNISGLDTVRATELLVASMKQLDLTTKDLIPLLSQITAAAGGQSGSITDIASALAVLAEAAESANIPLKGQIAAVQVISQVTGKSADQTANAFKNLFGAINSDSSIKKLDEFSIAVRDANGELRPFLDIYRDIADAVRSGVIPEGRLNEVLRAISGGRTGRQADAAALLANIYKVFEVEGIAENASNEALIANAKILDTNQAKITRFQNAFDITIFKQFNDTIADLTATLADLGTVFATVFGGIPTEVLTLTVQLVALAAAIKLLSKAGAALNLGGLFGGIKKNLLPTAPIAGLIEQAGLSSTIQLPRSLQSLLPIEQQLALNLGRYGTTSTGLASRGVSTTPFNYQRNQSVVAVGPYPTSLATSTAGLLDERSPNFWPNPFYPNAGTYSSPRTPTNIDERRLRWPERVIDNVPYRSPQLSRGDLNLYGDEAPINLAKRMADIGFPIKMDNETKSVLSRFLGIFNKAAGSRAGKFGIGAAIGGGAAAAAGGEFSGLAQLAGSALLFTPAAPIGAGLLIGGAIIDHFTTQANEAKNKIEELQSTLYNLTLQWKQDAAGVSAATTAYDTISKHLQGAQVGTEKYIDLQNQLAEASIDLALALDTQAGSTAKIIETLQTLGRAGGNDELSKYAQGFIGKSLNSDQLTELVGLVSKQILEASGQSVYRPTTTTYPLNYGPASNQGIPLYQPGFFGPERKEISTESFALDSNFFKQFLNQYKPIFGGPIDYEKTEFPFENPAAISAFQTAADTYLQNLPADQRQAFINDVINPFQEAVAQFGNATSQISQALLNARAEIEARKLLGLLSGDKAGIADANINAAERLQAFINSPNAQFASTGGPDDRTSGINRADSDQTILQLQANALSGTFDPKLLKTAADDALKSLGVWGEFPTTLSLTTAEAKILREEFHLTDEQIVSILGSLGKLQTTASEALEAAIAKTKEWADSGLAGVGEKLLDLQARLQGGEFKDNPKLYNYLKAQLDAIQQAYASTADGVVNTISEASDAFNTAFGENSASKVDLLTTSLNSLGVQGFLGVKGSIDDVNSAFINMITRLNLSGPQIAKVIGIWIQALSIFTRLQILSQQIGLIGLTPIPKGYTGGPASLGQFDQQTRLTTEYTNLINQLKGITKTGTGTFTPYSSTGTTTKATTDTLYLSDEQEKLADPLALVKQAYQDALKLQAQIPGETKANKLNTVLVFDELQKIFTAKGVSEELLRKALDNLTEQMNIANQKANIVKRIRVGAGDFSAIANVPVNSSTGVSVGSQNQINITFNLNGTALSPANFTLLANMIGAEIARRL